ncbi:MAG TPA: cyclase family protein [Acidimicrobiales bacterium]|nr:cyclase family protein [Acidimicrobiales bacterium]
MTSRPPGQSPGQPPRQRPRQPPTQDEVLAYFDELSNWGRWGPDDERGTLNFVTPDVVRRAVATVTEGVGVSCALDIVAEHRPDQIAGAPQRHMLVTGEPADPRDPQRSRAWGPMEYIGLAFHGFDVTHVDALAHGVWEGRLYNGRPAASVTARSGALEQSVLAAASGITTRGVLLDIPPVRSVAWLGGGDGVFPEDLEAAEERQGVRVGPGDAVLLRTGYGAKRRRHGHEDMLATGQPGWHAACLPWLHERQVALIGSDTSQEVVPSGYDRPALPVHRVGIVAMGLWLLDNGDFEDPAEWCDRLGRWEFLFVTGPLRIDGGTGSPVNPIALF